MRLWTFFEGNAISVTDEREGSTCWIRIRSLFTAAGSRSSRYRRCTTNMRRCVTEHQMVIIMLASIVIFGMIYLLITNIPERG